MKFQQIISLICLCCMWDSILAYNSQYAVQETRPRRYCGRNLAQALSVLCYDDFPEKRSEQESGATYNENLPPFADEQISVYGWPLIPDYRAQSSAVAVRRPSKRLVVSECCEKSCTISELMNYC